MATTIVSGNLADIQGVTWINAPIEITFVPNPSKPGPVIWADGLFNPGPILIFSDASGNFSIPLPSTDTIQPSNSTWLFSIGPNASAQAVLLNIGVTGTMMDISTLFTQRSNALIIQSLRVPRAYATFELETPVNEGQLWWNTTLGVFQFWNGSTWDSIVGTIPPPVGNVIVPNPTGSQSITQPPGTDFTVATSGGGIFAVNGDMSVNGQLTVENSIKAYGSEGIDLTANHIKIGTGLGDGNPLITIVQAGGAVNEKLWLIAANLNQLYSTCTSDGGQDHAWLLVTRVGIDVVDIEFTSAVIGMSGDLNVAGTITAANASFTTAEVGGSEVVTFANIPGGTFVYPEPGIAVSDGSGWLSSINPATVAYVNVSNTFLADQLIAGSLTISGGVAAGSVIASTGTGNVSTAAINMDFLGDAGRIITISATGSSTPPDFIIAVLNGTGTNYAEILHYTVADDTTHFRPNVICDQTLTVTGAKNFAISHPFRENKNLVHSCIEGPEVAVFYRGEIITQDGLAEVLLPDYFESLTFMEDRSVLLTQIYDDEYPALVLMAASRIENGRFKIKTIGRARIAWEVKAVRRIGVDRLVVEPDKEIINA